MLRKYTPDPAHIVDWGQIEVEIDGTFEEGQYVFLIFMIRFYDARP